MELNKFINCSYTNAFHFLNSSDLTLFSSLAVLDDNQIQVFTTSDKIVALLEFLKLDESTNAAQLLDIFATSSIFVAEKLEINYILITPFDRIWVKAAVPPLLQLESASPIFSSAGWLEREVWDLFGIYFSLNNDLRRIVTDYGFEGYPLRKDFPLSGYYETRYDDTQKRIVLEPVKFTQEFRTFTFTSPWENVNELQRN